MTNNIFYILRNFGEIYAALVQVIVEKWVTK